MDSPWLEKPIHKLILNELFVAEKDVGKTSIYRLEVDDVYLGKFKSSGIIISTGTGSTGWLFSCRRISQSDVRTILNYLGNAENLEMVSISYVWIIHITLTIGWGALCQRDI